MSAFNHDASEIKSKHEGEDSMFFLGTSAGTQVLLDKCSSSSRSYKNTGYGGNKNIGKYEICMKYVDIFSSSTSISSKYKGSMKYDNKTVRQQEEWRYSLKFSWAQVQAIKSNAGEVVFSFFLDKIQ